MDPVGRDSETRIDSSVAIDIVVLYFTFWETELDLKLEDFVLDCFTFVCHMLLKRLTYNKTKILEERCACLPLVVNRFIWMQPFPQQQNRELRNS